MKIAVCGSGGKIGYNLLFRLFTDVFKTTQQNLQIFCLEIPECLKHMQSVIKEIEDCNFPQIQTIKACTVLDVCLCELDLFIILSSATKAPSEPRDVLLSRNCFILNSIFTKNIKSEHNHFNNFNHYNNTTKSSNSNSNKINKKERFPSILIISNPANSMAWATSKLLPFIPKSKIFSLSQLDHKRALILFSNKMECEIKNVNNLFILGNHSKTAVPVISFITINGINFKKILNFEKLNLKENKNIKANIKEWFKNEFNEEVRERNYRMVKYRGFGSCCSVVTAIIDNVKTILYGNKGTISTIGMIVDIYKKGLKINDTCVSVPVEFKDENKIEISDLIFEIDEAAKIEFLKSLEELENEKKKLKAYIESIKN